MNKFRSLYKTEYTVPIKEKNRSEFSSKYGAKNTDIVVISGDSRPRNLRFRSRLVEK